jgi:hypothetical protein
MTKTFDDYAEGEDLPIKLLTRCRIVDHDAPGLLVMLVEYFGSMEDEDARKISAINLALNVDAAEMLGAALIDSAKKRRKEPETKQ